MMRGLMTLPLAGLVLTLASCGRPAAGPPPTPTLSATVEESNVAEEFQPDLQPVGETPPPLPPPPPPPPVPDGTAFRYPSDRGGVVVAAALAPALPPDRSVPLTSQPRVRVSSIDRGDLPIAEPGMRLPDTPRPKIRETRPTPPAERTPRDLGNAAVLDTSRVLLPVRDAVRIPAPVVDPVADLPRLAQQTPDRVSVADPTAELSAFRTVWTALSLPDPAVWFQKFGIPDPFELTEHLKGKTGLDRELGTSPAPVPPLKK